MNNNSNNNNFSNVINNNLILNNEETKTEYISDDEGENLKINNDVYKNENDENDDDENDENDKYKYLFKSIEDKTVKEYLTEDKEIFNFLKSLNIDVFGDICKDDPENEKLNYLHKILNSRLGSRKNNKYLMFITLYIIYYGADLQTLKELLNIALWFITSRFKYNFFIFINEAEQIGERGDYYINKLYFFLTGDSVTLPYINNNNFEEQDRQRERNFLEKEKFINDKKALFRPCQICLDMKPTAGPCCRCSLIICNMCFKKCKNCALCRREKTAEGGGGFYKNTIEDDEEILSELTNEHAPGLYTVNFKYNNKITPTELNINDYNESKYILSFLETEGRKACDWWPKAYGFNVITYESLKKIFYSSHYNILTVEPQILRDNARYKNNVYNNHIEYLQKQNDEQAPELLREYLGLPELNLFNILYNDIFNDIFKDILNERNEEDIFDLGYITKYFKDIETDEFFYIISDNFRDYGSTPQQFSAEIDTPNNNRTEYI